MILRTPSEIEFQKIRSFIKEYELDDRFLEKEQFIAAFRREELLGFGRLLFHTDCTELCSLAVITPFRRKGIGKAIVHELIKKANSKLCLVCIIPEYFTPMGFVPLSKTPEAIIEKLKYCKHVLAVPEDYVAMAFQKD